MNEAFYQKKIPGSESPSIVAFGNVRATSTATAIISATSLVALWVLFLLLQLYVRTQPHLLIYLPALI